MFQEEVKKREAKFEKKCKQYLKKHGKPHPMIEETKRRQEEFIQNMGNLLLNKVEVNIGSTTFVTEFDNGEQTDYTLIELDNLRKEAQKLIDDIHDGDKV